MSTPHGPPGSPARVGRLVATARLLLVAAALLYLGVVVEAVAGWPLDPVSSYLSELAALDQPTSTLFRSMDLAAAIFVVGGLALLVIAYRRDRADGGAAASRAQRVVFWALLTFGAATMIDALLPLDCALSVGDCAAREDAGDVSLAHQAHTFSSVTAGLSSFVVSAGVVWLARARRRTLLGFTARLAGALGPVLGVVTGAIGMFGSPLPVGTGIAQRIQIIAFAVVLALVVPVLTLRRPGPSPSIPVVPTAEEALTGTTVSSFVAP